MKTFRFMLLILSLNSATAFVPSSYTPIGAKLPRFVSNLKVARRQFPTLSTFSSVALMEIDRSKQASIFSRAFAKYVYWCKHMPILTKAVSGSIVASAGAILSQWMESASTGSPFLLNLFTVKSFALTGLLFEAPFLNWWYNVLWRMAKRLDPEGNKISSKVMTLAQIFVDQTVGVVLFFPLYFAAFEVAQSMLSFRLPNVAALQTKMATELVPVVQANFLIWPAASWVIFRRVPEELRVLATNLIAVFWNAYLCSLIG